MRKLQLHHSVIASVSEAIQHWIATSLTLLAMTAILSAYPLTVTAADTVTFLSDEQLAKQHQTIERVERYLSGLTTITADFTQIAPDGALTGGKFFLMRPGKMRWQYNPPTPILMVANGTELVYYDYELEQVSYIPLDSTLIGFMAQEVIRFDKTVGIIALENKHDAIRITLAQRDKPTEGELTLEFSDKPLLIRKMVVRDATNQVTTVSLNNATFGAKLDKKMFIFIDPRNRWRNAPLNKTKGIPPI